MEIDKSKLIRGIFLVFILASVFYFATKNNDFPLGFHPDEHKKVGFIINDKQDFKHPMLILQTGKIVNQFIGATNSSELIIAVRYMTAFYLTLSTFFLFLLGKILLNYWQSALLAVVYGLSPAMLIHGHFMKEDVALVCFLLLSLYTLFLYVKDPKKWLFLGVAFGLCVSTHYKSVVFVFILLFLPFISEFKFKDHYKTMLKILGVSVVVFLLINYPIILNLKTFKTGFLFELNHSIEGHSLKLYPWLVPFFHIKKSLIPGMGWVLSILSGTSFLYLSFNYKSIKVEHKILLLFVILFYLFIELSPLKPSPGYVRYILPILPVLLLLMFCILNHIKKRKWMVVLTGLIVIGFCFEFYRSIGILNTITDDTRYQVANYVEQNKLNVVYDNYAYLENNKKKSIKLNKKTLQELNASDVDFLAISSFESDRYIKGQHLKQQRDIIYTKGKMYQELIDQKCVKTFTSSNSYSFFGPTIYLIDLNK